MMPKKAPFEELEKVQEILLAESQLNLNFLFLVVSSCLIATLGLLTNSAGVIIGAMIIAPLMMPLRGLAFAVIEVRPTLFQHSLKSLGMGTIVAILMSSFVGTLFGIPASSFGSEILARTQPNLADLIVAIAAGAVSGFAMVRPDISDALAGTAIAVALMPPLCVVGIGLSQRDLSVSSGAFGLYITNFLGIVLACMLVFIWAGYQGDFRQVRRALGWFVGLTGLLTIPLFISLSTLLQRAQLKAAITDILTRETITIGQDTELNDIQVRWSSPWSQKPSIVFLTVYTAKPITIRQVHEVETFLSRRLERPFIIVLRAIRFDEIQGNEAETP